MRDWDEGEVRDRLPLLAAGMLRADEAATMRARIAGDAALGDELALLTALREAHAATPAIDTARIVAALPSPRPALRVERTTRATFSSGHATRLLRWSRAAAAVAVLAIGALTTYIGRGASDEGSAVPATAVATELRLGLPLEELSDDQLSALEAEIRTLDGLPREEPEAGAAHGGLEIGA
jgi:hypothetical protein